MPTWKNMTPEQKRAWGDRNDSEINRGWRERHLREGRPVRAHPMRIKNREQILQDAFDAQEMRRLDVVFDNAIQDFEMFPSAMTSRGMHEAQDARDAFRDSIRDQRHVRLRIA